MNPEDLLTETLHERVERTDYPSTSPATVATRARAVRHRRRRSTALVAAAVAVVVAGVTGTVWLDHRPDATPGPAGRLDPAGLLPDVPQGGAPGVDYLEGDTYVTSTGLRITSPTFATTTSATPDGDGILVAGPTTVQRPLPVLSLVFGGTTTRLGCGSPSFAPGAATPAYWVSDRCRIGEAGRLVQDSGTTRTARGLVYTPIGSTSATLVADVKGLVPHTPSGAFLVAPDGSRQRIPHLLIVSAASGTLDLVAGFTTRSLDPVVADAATGAVRWRAKAWSLGSFSMSGRYLSGTQKLGDQTVEGVGDVVGIWDAATGRQVTRVVLPNMTVVGRPAWEGDGSVLVVAEDRDHQQAIVRVGVDGDVTRATAVAPAGQGTFRLATTS